MAEYAIPEQLRRRTPEERDAYLRAKAPDVAAKFSCTEDEALEILRSVDSGGGTLVVLPDRPGDEAEVTPAKGSIRFVLERPDDERLNFSIEFEGQGAEEITLANHDEHGWDGMDLLADTVKSIGEALGIEVVER